jgi:hypothetical protein
MSLKKWIKVNLNKNKYNKFLKLKNKKQKFYIRKFTTFKEKFYRKLIIYSKVFYNKGNIEFLIFSTIVGFGLFYVHKNKEKFGENTKLASTGILTHVLVDFLTYNLDKLNTKAKIDYFFINKNINISNGIKDIHYYFNKKYVLFKSSISPKKKTSSFDLENSLKDFRNKLELRGIQSAMVFLVFNSAIFYGLYKNLKNFLSEKFHIVGFSNFFLSAGLAQFVAMMIAFPLENMKTRMQASNFHYESIYKYYYKMLVVKRRLEKKTLLDVLKLEYSGFFSHLLLYVIYESITFGIYESLICKLSKDPHEEKKFSHIIYASVLSGLVAAVLTNPVDVYQINKQINPNFSYKQLNFHNSLAGLKERTKLITFVNLTTFLFLETLGPKLFGVHLE